MSEKPGVMIYFEIREMLRRMDNEMRGILFQAIMDYGATREVPTDLPEPLYLFWPVIQARLDTDNDRYNRISLKKRYAIYTRWAKQRNETPLSFADWSAEYHRYAAEEEQPV